ncbi:MAG: SRPBCC family protein [Ginsengibacter sp.]
MTDPNVKKDYKGTDGTVGFVYAWDSDNKKVGKGEQEIKKTTEGDRMDLEIRFIKPFEGKADSYITTESISENQTKVRWGFNSQMPYPMNIMRLFMNIEKMLGNDLEASLINLKNVLEKQ